MIDLNKKYKTTAGWDVVLFEISDKIYGKVNYFNTEWQVFQWTLSGNNRDVDSRYNLVEVPNFEIKNLNCKCVTYFGYKLYVPVWANWISTDVDGKVWVYVNKPTISITRHLYNDGNGFPLLPKIEYKGNWRTSLMEIK